MLKKLNYYIKLMLKVGILVFTLLGSLRLYDKISLNPQERLYLKIVEIYWVIGNTVK